MLEIFVRLQSLMTQREKGATAVEYGIMVALIAAVIIGTVAAIGDQLLIEFNTVLTELTT
ncbi:Flp family type IVb pilin [Janibacter cremeus]|uniref:Flp family type IVb pilin n=1 Tax=Janibacter cremeus TaxID=1285192 RepID=UPI0023F9B30F|nr:Flp family type IVb pilin [Janibacter cremeus]WEV76996.1 Flp family type IVb pilin [Janibacter cremeus]